MPDPFWERAPGGKLHRPDGPEQEVLANGMQCGDQITGIIKGWYESEYGPIRGDVAVKFAAALKYPIDLPTDIVEPRTPHSEMTALYNAENLPILAWSVAPSGYSCAVVVDMSERGQSNYPDCQVLRGTPNELLPLEIQEEYRLGFGKEKE